MHAIQVHLRSNVHMMEQFGSKLTQGIIFKMEIQNLKHSLSKRTQYSDYINLPKLI